MLLINKKFFLYLIIILALFGCFQGASAMIRVSDRISLSWPGTGANHTISFYTVENIPASGRIDIVPEDGEFFIFGGFDYTDVDIATSANSDGSFVDRQIASSASAIYDTVSAVSSTTSGTISIIMNSSYGIPPNTYVEIEFGTNATFGDLGDRQIVNSSNTGSFKFDVRSYTDTGVLLKKARPMLAILEPVTMGNNILKSRLFGAPIGWLSFGTTQTILSLVTNFNSRCRYSIASGTLFAAMTEEFTYASASSSQYHTKIINGLANGQSYEYFVRCRDDNSVSDDETKCLYIASTTPYTTASGSPITSLNCVDYWIPFSISGQAGDSGDDTGAGDDTDADDDGVGDTGGDSAGGGGSGGGSGRGSGNDRGRTISHYLPFPPPPGAPGVIFSGFAYPNADVAVLKDGTEVGYIKANADAEFNGFLEELTQGVYTFTLWAEDELSRRSSNYSTTFWLDDGTQTTVSNIIIPPTIAVNKTVLNQNETFEVLGVSTPGSQVEVWLYAETMSAINEDDVIKEKGIVDANGNWSFYMRKGLSEGSYQVKARTFTSDIDVSGFSQVIKISIGEGEVEGGLCEGADLNQDGRVNITDFSILLYYWNTDNECADQNKSGNVDLIDFSIMMYFWTG